MTKWNHTGAQYSYKIFASAAAKSLQLCLTLCDPVDGSPPGSPVPGILQARTLEWVAISISNAWKWKVKRKSLSHVWLCDPMDCSPPGSSVHGIFQARVLEWGAITNFQFVNWNRPIIFILFSLRVSKPLGKKRLHRPHCDIIQYSSLFDLPHLA